MQFSTVWPASKAEINLVLFAFEKEKGFVNALGKEWEKLREMLEQEGFSGKEATATLAYPLDQRKGTRVIVLGLGPRPGWGRILAESGRTLGP